ncbi:MAG: hydrogenase 3 maturation endopeptidase HyCI [candidate division KSB1 bacterium]|nr:hydrogenase 3 maturation endopeptidase HyCI [candidate division KSB1 bacterium]MDZ7378030.1 hydrogenase 3 maturation endopeptidase HyCI [candidate division KSB1 bacterium]MDZ7385316.1 hydrogenase 3 maturation endopeptidase HyCI [candidate division KSB1 bacterium]
MKRAELARALAALLDGRVVLLGVGSEWRRDDQAGAILARKLERTHSFYPIDCGDVPEAFTGPVKEFRPDIILIADAVDFGQKAGEIAIVDAEAVQSRRVDTHHPSLRAMVDYLRAETGAKVAILGIQPGDVSMGEGMTPAVQESVGLLHALITELLGTTSDEGATP